MSCAIKMTQGNVH